MTILKHFCRLKIMRVFTRTVIYLFRRIIIIIIIKHQCKFITLTHVYYCNTAIYNDVIYMVYIHAHIYIYIHTLYVCVCACVRGRLHIYT